MLRRQLETGDVSPADALARLGELLAAGAPRAKRAEAYQLVGDIAGRAFDTPWEIAERAAWVLLGAALAVDTISERRALLLAMGRGFRNIWLLPFVHARLDDEDPDTAEAAIHAAGGLGFPGLEAALASFLDEETAPALRLAAIRALGRAGAASAAPRLAALALDPPPVGSAALAALTEIRSPAGVEAALALLAGDPGREVLVAAVRYLSEMGRDEVAPAVRRLGRDTDADLRLVAAQAARALEAEAKPDPSERLLAALTQRDRVVRALLARRLRLLPSADVLAEAEVLLADDAEGVVQVVGELRTPDTTHFLLAVATDRSRPAMVRARAAGAIEADEPWEREALAGLALGSALDAPVRVAAAQALGAFASLDELLARLDALAADPSPALRGAFLWALQLAARPHQVGDIQRARPESLLRAALADADPTVRRRAAYVTGNLRLAALASDLIELGKRSDDRVEIRVAAFVALGELAPGDAVGSVAALPAGGGRGGAGPGQPRHPGGGLARDAPRPRPPFRQARAAARLRRSAAARGGAPGRRALRRGAAGGADRRARGRRLVAGARRGAHRPGAPARVRDPGRFLAARGPYHRLDCVAPGALGFRPSPCALTCRRAR